MRLNCSSFNIEIAISQFSICCFKGILGLFLLLYSMVCKAQYHNLTDTNLVFIGSKHGTNDSMVYWFSGEDTIFNSQSFKILKARFRDSTFTVGAMHQNDSGLVTGFFAGDDKVLPMYRWRSDYGLANMYDVNDQSSCRNSLVHYTSLFYGDSILIDFNGITRNFTMYYLNLENIQGKFRVGNENKFNADSIITGRLIWVEGFGANYGVLNSSYFFCLNPDSWLFRYFPHSVGISHIVSKSTGELIFSYSDSIFNDFNYGSATKVSTIPSSEVNVWIDVNHYLRTSIPQEEINEIKVKDLNGRVLLTCKQEPCSFNALPSGVYFVEIQSGASVITKKIMKLS